MQTTIGHLQVQLGGCDPKQMGAAAALCVAAGYDEVGINVGCPSPTVASNKFGPSFAPRLSGLLSALPPSRLRHRPCPPSPPPSSPPATSTSLHRASSTTNFDMSPAMYLTPTAAPGAVLMKDPRRTAAIAAVTPRPKAPTHPPHLHAQPFVVRQNAAQVAGASSADSVCLVVAISGGRGSLCCAGGRQRAAGHASQPEAPAWSRRP